MVNSAILDSVRGQSSVGNIQKEGVHIIYICVCVSVCYVRCIHKGVVYIYEIFFFFKRKHSFI